jgi:hypothetical protein
MAHIPIFCSPAFSYVSPFTLLFCIVSSLLIEFATENKKRIANTLIRRNDINKFSWSIIHYILVNKETATLVKVTRVSAGDDIYSDHFLVIAKLTMRKIWKKKFYKSKRKKK